MGFRPFLSADEEARARALIATVDKGEQWIFDGAEGSNDFGGFIDRLYYCNEETFGVFCSCVFEGKLRVIMGFNTDMPHGLGNEIRARMEKARQQLNTFTSVWYVPTNNELDRFLFNDLPWNAEGHKTHEFTAFRQDFCELDVALPEGVSIIPFNKTYHMDTCVMLEEAMAHTHNLKEGLFLPQQEQLLKEWTQKAASGECCVMVEDNEVIGAYILKGAEIDIMATAVEHQGKGRGRQLLSHALKHIFTTCEANPYLYCIDDNPHAISFYKSQGLTVTGHSGYVFFPKIACVS